jgi:type I restriction enzyme S subunit
MGSEWTTIGDIALVFDGPHATPEKVDEGPYYLSISSLENGKLDLSKSPRISEEQFIQWTKRVAPKEGDVLFSYETRLGEAALMPSGIRACLGRRMGILRPDTNKVDPRYLLFAYIGPEFQNEIRTRTNPGATVDRLAVKELPFFPIRLPPLPEQRTIAHILGTLDDKIELNRQMNATLEAMAQALFQSWFVDFDPVIDNALAAGHPIPDALQERAAARAALGHRRQPLPAAIQSQFPSGFVRHEEMGWVPEGWAVSTIGHEIQAVGGGTPSTKDASFWEDGVHAFCTPKDMSLLDSLVLTAAERQLTDAGVAQISSGQLPAGVVLLSSSAPIGYLAISHIPVSVNQGIIAMLPNANYEPLYLVCWVRFNMDKILDRANGSTFLEISKKNFAPIPFLVPNRAALDSYNLHAKTIYEKLLLLAQENEKLITLRDTLLPKLLSGAVRVAAAG